MPALKQQLKIVNKAGVVQAEPESFSIDEVSWKLNEPGHLRFTLPTADASLARSGGPELVANGSFEVDSNADGLVDSWNTFSSSGSFVPTRVTSPVVAGTFAQQIIVTGLTSGDAGYFYDFINTAVGQPYTVSGWIRVVSLVNAKVVFAVNGTALGTLVISELPAISSGLVHYTGSFVAADALTSIQVKVVATGAGGAGTFIVDSMSATSSGYWLPRLLEDEVQVWADEQLLWWGVAWQDDPGPDETTFDCDELLSYFHNRYVTNASQDFTSIDQLTIGWKLIEFTQLLSYGGLNVSSSAFSASGIPRSRKYDRDEHGNVLDLLAEFPGLVGGFDYAIEVYPDGRREFTPYYPAKGSFKPELALEWPRNIASFAAPGDATNLIDEAWVTGGTSGDTKFENTYFDTAAAQRFGRQQGIISDGSELDVNWLLLRAQQEVATRNKVARIPKPITLRAPTDYLHQAFVGDTLPLKINRGRVQVDGVWRIYTKSWNPQDDTVTLEMAEP